MKNNYTDPQIHALRMDAGKCLDGSLRGASSADKSAEQAARFAMASGNIEGKTCDLKFIGGKLHQRIHIMGADGITSRWDAVESE